MRFASIMAGAALLLFAAAATAQDDTAEATFEGPKVSWRVATYPPPRASTSGLHTIADYVSERSGGQFTIEVGYGTYGDPRDFLDLMSIGSIQGAVVQTAITGGGLPLYTVLDLPFLPLAETEVQQAVHDELHRHPAILAEFERWNAVPFMSSLIPQYELVGAGTPPQSPDDMKGWRVRAQGEMGRAIEQLEASPATMPATEVYVALERGLVEAVAQPYYAIKSYRLDEIGDWMTTNLSLGTTGVPLVFSRQAWNDLPPEYRDLLEEAREVAYAAQKQAMDAEQQLALDYLKPLLTPIQFSDATLEEFRARAGEPIWDAWVEQMEAAGRPGREILDLVMKTAEAAQ
jgi:TRAP-type C4-dicarboxylate transport system substrate-binding protein